MIRALALARAADAPAAADEVTLPYDERYRRRAVLTTAAGEQVLMDLAEAQELGEGDALLLEDGRALRIRAAPEPLTEVRAGQGQPLARLAWHIGNRHTPCAIGVDHLLIRRDHVLEDMLTRLGATLMPVDAPFTPEGGAYGHGRTHGHHHGASAHDDPNAHIPHRHG
ncbi:MAG: urease accessory protein UreE [Pseudomonadota bacterium]